MHFLPDRKPKMRCPISDIFEFPTVWGQGSGHSLLGVM
jgi:hypothetical protein